MHIFFAKLFLFVTGVFLISTYVNALLLMGLDALFMPMFGLKLKSVNFLGLRFENARQGGWHRLPYKRSQLISHHCGVNIDKPIPEDIDRREEIALFLTRGLELALSVGVLVLCLPCFSRAGNLLTNALEPTLHIGAQVSTLPDWFLMGFAIGMVCHSLFSFGTTVYIYTVMMKKLAGYTNSILKRMRAGENISEMHLRPVAELPYQNPTKIEIMLYYSIYLFYLHLHKDIDAMRPVIAEMTEYYRNREFSESDIMNYGWMIFWYSRYDLDPQAAKVFYDRVSNVLVKDPEANSKRILGYYAFGIERDLSKAQQLVNEGLAVVDKFSLPGEEREMERQLLLELQGFIDQQRNQVQGVPL